ncbi:MAG: methylenetetrahydrofolate reductase [Helicobacteraceae bacterium]|nr:methylenetetrahydrofolate reductase [Helicobacteraceae bacterium]
MFSALIENLHNGSWLTLEVSPEKSAAFETVIQRLRSLRLWEKVDGFTVTDNPLAKLRYGSLFAAIRLQEAFGKPVLATISMRDRNLLGIQSDLLGCNEAGIRAILAVTGDPAHLSDQPRVKGVFDANSMELLKITRHFNRGIDYAGKEIDPAPKPIFPFAVTSAKITQSLKRKMAGKIENGAIGLISQPIFSIEDADRLLEVFDEAQSEFSDERRDARLIFGIFPLTRLKTAQFLHAHVPGITIPDRFLSALYEANKVSEEREYAVGFEMSFEIFKMLRRRKLPIHIMSSNRFETVNKMICSKE